MDPHGWIMCHYTFACQYCAIECHAFHAAWKEAAHDNRGHQLGTEVEWWRGEQATEMCDCYHGCHGNLTQSKRMCAQLSWIIWLHPQPVYGFSSCSTVPGLKEVGSGGVFVLDSETVPLPEQSAAAGSSSSQATASKRPALEGETVGVINAILSEIHL